MNKKIYIGIATTTILAILATTAFSLSIIKENIEQNNLSENYYSDPIILSPSRTTDNFKEIDEKNLKNESTKIVNGIEYTKVYDYWLPPEPDSDLNNSTLLGIDVNNNKVRDDIERRIVMNPKWSAGLKGAKLQEARTYFLAMESPEKYPNIKDLLLKSYLLEMYYQKNRSINSNEEDREDKENLKANFNTDERKLAYAKVQGKFSGGMYSIMLQPHRFVERYADYTVSERGTLKDYELKPEAYDNKPTPYYSEIGNIQGHYNNGETNDLSAIEFCEVNYGTSDYKDCKEKSNKLMNLIKEQGVDKLIKQGIINE